MLIRTLSTCLVAAALTLLAPAAPVEAATSKTNDTSGYVAGSYYTSAWTWGWDYNRGSFTRTWQTSNNGKNLDYFWINWNQNRNPSYVGFDAGVGWNIPGGTEVIDLIGTNPRTKIKQKLWYKWTKNISPQSGGFWLMGPKTIIYEKKYWDNQLDLDRQYECYIVDDSNLSRSDLVKEYGLTARGSNTYITKNTKNDGKRIRYYHYTRTLKHGAGFDVYQVFSIRAKYRGNNSRDFTAVNDIMRHWKIRGLVPGHYYNLGWKINIETDGNFNASECGCSYLSFPKN